MAFWVALAALAAKSYSSYQSGKSASQSQNQAYDRIIAQLDKAFQLNVEQTLLTSGGYGFANLASYLYRGEYSPGQLQNMSDQSLLQAAEKYGVEPTYRTEYSSGIKRRGGLAGAFGGTKTYKIENKTLNRNELIAKLEPLAVQPFEKGTLGPDLMETYDQGQSPTENLAAMRGIQERFQPTVDAAGREASDLFSGQQLQDQLSELQPVETAERQKIAGIADAYATQTAEQMNQLRSSNLAKYGSASTGLGQRRLGAQLGLASAESLAGMRGDLNVGQASRRAGLQEASRQAKMSNLGLGAQMAQQAGQYSTMPSDMAGQYQTRRAGWMQPASIKQPQPQTYDPFTQFKPVASTGQIQSGLMSKIFDQMYKASGGMNSIMGGGGGGGGSV
mgnify:CR=1 FL=1|tara:strand:- start:296 stop:1465 length:1170 start_codon:yes stop_codon:yes gene_type:complete